MTTPSERMIEALLFAASAPLGEDDLKRRLPADVDIPEALQGLAESYAGRGVELACVAGRWRFQTAPDLEHLMTEERTEPRSARTDMLPYSIDVVCLDQSGIVSGLSGFFATRGIDIAEVSTRSYPAAHTGAPMFAVQMIVNVPSRIHVAHLREEFMEFCDSLNLDAILEPVKS